MAAVKLNVLHWHLSEDQGFRVESRVFPKLHELGSGGLYYTQDEILDLISYARDRGVRVMPEFDMPGHATSWFVGYPELASAPGPYEIVETWGIQDPAMDPTREETYDFLSAFIAEMADLFPDRYFHIGGDEVNGRQWDANAALQQFIVGNDLVDNYGLQTYFNRRIQPLLAERNKTMMGWDEIFQPGLPEEAVVHSWRGPDGVAAAARAGYRTVLSNGYYIDLARPASHHYAVDPLGGPAAELDEDQRRLVLGGEATMWGEYVVDETIDSRIWPRTVAIAERLWSGASVTEVDDMYRRLEVTSRWLEWVGVTHRSGYAVMLTRLSAGHAIAPLRTLADLLEPVKGYRRGRTRAYSRFTPLNRLVDAARPESAQARAFGAAVDAYLAAGGDRAGELRFLIEEQLVKWRDNHEGLATIAASSTMLPEAEALSAQLRTTAEVGMAALGDIDAGAPTSDREYASRLSRLERADIQHGALQLMVVETVRRLVDAARTGRR
jgi:hexosaminidase